MKGQGLVCKAFSTFLFPNHLIVAAQRSGEVPRVRPGTGGVSARQQQDGAFGSAEVSVSAYWSRDLTGCSMS